MSRDMNEKVAVGTEIRWQNQRDTVNKINKMASEEKKVEEIILEMLAKLKVRIRWWCSKKQDRKHKQRNQFEGDYILNKIHKAEKLCG